MKDAEVIQIQLATRIPRELHRRLKLFSVQNEASVQQIVTAALGAYLAKEKGKK